MERVGEVGAAEGVRIDTDSLEATIEEVVADSAREEDVEEVVADVEEVGAAGEENVVEEEIVAEEEAEEAFVLVVNMEVDITAMEVGTRETGGDRYKKLGPAGMVG